MIYIFQRNKSGDFFKQFNDLTETPKYILILDQYEYDFTNFNGASNLAFNEKTNFDLAVELSNEYNVPLHIVTGSVKLPEFNAGKNIYLHHWGTFYFSFTKYCIKFIRKPFKSVTDQKFKFPFINLNGAMKPHRCMTVDLLSKYNLLDKGAVTWNEIVPWEVPEGILPSIYSNYEWKYWSPKILSLDEYVLNPGQKLTHKGFNQFVPPIQFHESFMSLITESSITDYMVSEKTVIPLLYGKPFLTIGPVGFHKMLEDMGFMLYDEIFDYSFDNEPDLEKRIDGIVKNVEKISNYSEYKLTELNNKIVDKITHNKNLATSIDIVPQIVLDNLQSIMLTNTQMKEMYTTVV